MRIATSLILMSMLLAVAGCQGDALPARTTAGREPAALESVCGFAANADPSRAVLAFTVGHDLKFTFADGATRTVHTFASQLASPRTSFIGRVDDVQGDRVLADGSSFYNPIAQPGRWASELVLLDRKGNVVWHRTAPGFGTPYLGADGTLSVWDTQRETLVVGADGATRTIAGMWSPIASARDGSLLVQQPPPVGDGHLGWLRPGQTSVERLAIQPSGYEEWVGDRLAYVGKQYGQDALVLASPDEARVVALPQGDGAGLAITGVAGDWLEVERYGATTPTIFRVNVRSGVVDAVQGQVPSGVRPFDVGGIGLPQLADDGSLLAGYRNDYVGSLYRSTDLGASWTPVGFSVANVQGLTAVAAAGGTFVAQSVRSVYAPDNPWSDPPAGVSPELSGQFVELARPSDGVRYQLPPIVGYRPVALGSGGRCAAYWAMGSDKTSGRLETLDVRNSRRTTLANASDVGGLSAPLWLER